MLNSSCSDYLKFMLDHTNPPRIQLDPHSTTIIDKQLTSSMTSRNCPTTHTFSWWNWQKQNSWNSSNRTIASPSLIDRIRNVNLAVLTAVQEKFRKILFPLLFPLISVFFNSTLKTINRSSYIYGTAYPLFTVSYNPKAATI